MKLVTYNIQYGKGRDGRIDLERIAAAVGAADIICLQEVERFWLRSGDTDQPRRLAALLGEHRPLFGANLDLAHERAGADGRPRFRRRQFGNMVLSRWPILSARNFLLPKAAEAPGLSMQRGALEAVIAAPGGPVRVYATHLCSTGTPARLPQVAHLRRLLADLPAQGAPATGRHRDPLWSEFLPPPFPPSVIVAGDFNFTFDSQEYRLLGEPLDGLGWALADAWTTAGRGADEGISFIPMEGGRERRIDHVFLSPEIARALASARIDNGAQGSDHFPLWVEFTDGG